MKHILLSQNQLALVDDDQYEWLNMFQWSARKHKSGRCYAVRRNEDGIYLYMHREIMDMSRDYPVPPDQVIDHIDDNGLNNQRSNLAVVSRKENTRRYHPSRSL